jgi:flagellar hook assembly protein FlgD
MSYPNPTRGETVVVFRVGAGLGPVNLSVYDTSGRRVANLMGGDLSKGEWSTTWDGRDDTTGEIAPSGTYFLRLEVGTTNVTEKITLVR